MRPEEAGEISRLVTASMRQAFASCYAAGVLEALIRGNSAEAFLKHAPKQIDYGLHSGNRIVAMIGLKRNEIGHLYVHPDCSGQGFGRTLVDFARTTLRTAGYESLMVLSALTAVEFYKKCGFTEELRGGFTVGDGLVLNYVRMNCPI